MNKALHFVSYLLSVRRFNFIDIISMSAFSSLMMTGNIIAAIVCIIAGPAIGFILEEQPK